ncbi:hypothetical protein J6590_041797 [Homalodisca vitripennis]|nr:hypothetical protein J6590_041797 [Homalodisca vitripennis]
MRRLYDPTEFAPETVECGIRVHVSVDLQLVISRPQCEVAVTPCTAEVTRSAQLLHSVLQSSSDCIIKCSMQQWNQLNRLVRMAIVYRRPYGRQNISAYKCYTVNEAHCSVCSICTRDIFSLVMLCNAGNAVQRAYHQVYTIFSIDSRWSNMENNAFPAFNLKSCFRDLSSNLSKLELTPA